MWLFPALLHWIYVGFIFCNENDLCDKDYSIKKKNCENLSSLDPNQPSVFILHASGRLGNHLMAFAIVLALAKSLKIRSLLHYLILCLNKIKEARCTKSLDNTLILDSQSFPFITERKGIYLSLKNKVCKRRAQI